MTKKNVIITIVILLALIGGVVLWNQKNSKQDIAKPKQQQVTKQTQEQKTTQKEQTTQKEDDNNQKQIIEHLSPEEIEKLKKEKDLVWYEIPELNIKFLVTKDASSDLDYFVRKSDLDYNIKHKNVYLFYKSIIKFNNKEWCKFKQKTKENNCSSLAMDIRKLKDKNAPADSCNRFVKIYNLMGLCLIHPQASIFKNYQDYKQYSQSIRDKDFSIYFNTIKEME